MPADPAAPPQACGSPFSRTASRQFPDFNGDALRYLVSSEQTIDVTDGNVGVLSQLVSQRSLHQKRSSTGLVCIDNFLSLPGGKKLEPEQRGGGIFGADIDRLRIMKSDREGIRDDHLDRKCR